ncbi:MAG TPA: aminotransferase class III-fold pyridoxal phosphate-dependent enzyme [Terriglobales bacterium]|nr:aminotransferase class III-fold pyridoxal phosphate-dependent enzyme [Terriglobales bacterium]
MAVRGEGVYVWDADGKRYLDFSGSAAVNFIGHGVREIGDAMAEQARQLEFVHTSQFTTPVAEEFAQELLEFAGENFSGGAVYFASGGSESIETALKLARQYQVEVGEEKRHQILSRQQSYHGSTLGALAVSGNRKRREIYLPMVREFEHIGIPYCYRCGFDCTDSCYNCGQQYAAELERAIQAAQGEVAGFIFEPMSGATLGAVTPPPGYLPAIAEICRRHGVLLIADEVMTGMGRTGRNFAVEHFSVEPDILVTAKGLSSGYAPLGAVVATKHVVDAIAGGVTGWQECPPHTGSGAFLHGFTYNAHPVSVAAGRAVLRRIRAQKLVRAADSEVADPGAERTAGSALKAALESLRDVDVVGDVRGLGLLWGVEFVADKKTKAPFAPEKNFAGMVGQACLGRGLLVYPMQGCVDGVAGDHLLIAPPAVITAEEIGWAVEEIKAAIKECSG